MRTVILMPNGEMVAIHTFCYDSACINRPDNICDLCWLNMQLPGITITVMQ